MQVVVQLEMVLLAQFLPQTFVVVWRLFELGGRASGDGSDLKLCFEDATEAWGLCRFQQAGQVDVGGDDFLQRSLEVQPI